MPSIDPPRSLLDNPFASADARAHSSYAALRDGRLVRLLDGRNPAAEHRFLDAMVRAFILHPDFPCLGAKGTIGSGGYRIGSYGSLADPAVVAGLARDLHAFSAEERDGGANLMTFAAGFHDLPSDDEATFEEALWQTLQRLHDADRKHYAAAPQTSEDPESAAYAFSFAARAYFVVGMHPGASRFARRFPVPLIVFNPKAQFEALRRAGRFERMRDRIRERDVRLQGSPNPNLADYGESSEARQYSGRAVEPEWRCPFRSRR